MRAKLNPGLKERANKDGTIIGGCNCNEINHTQ